MGTGRRGLRAPSREQQSPTRGCGREGGDGKEGMERSRREGGHGGASAEMAVLCHGAGSRATRWRGPQGGQGRCAVPRGVAVPCPVPGRRRDRCTPGLAPAPAPAAASPPLLQKRGGRRGSPVQRAGLPSAVPRTGRGTPATPGPPRVQKPPGEGRLGVQRRAGEPSPHCRPDRGGNGAHPTGASPAVMRDTRPGAKVTKLYTGQTRTWPLGPSCCSPCARGVRRAGPWPQPQENTGRRSRAGAPQDTPGPGPALPEPALAPGPMLGPVPWPPAG